jgi:hypothetical protein
VEAELDILDKTKYLSWREILVKSAQSLSDLVVVASTTNPLHLNLTNIQNIITSTRIILRILHYLRSALNKTSWPLRWARKKALKNKIDSLGSVISIIEFVNNDIFNGRFTTGLFQQLETTT